MRALVALGSWLLRGIPPMASLFGLGVAGFVLIDALLGLHWTMGFGSEPRVVYEALTLGMLAAGLGAAIAGRRRAALALAGTGALLAGLDLLDTVSRGAGVELGYPMALIGNAGLGCLLLALALYLLVSGPGAWRDRLLGVVLGAAVVLVVLDQIALWGSMADFFGWSGRLHLSGHVSLVLGALALGVWVQWARGGPESAEHRQEWRIGAVTGSIVVLTGAAVGAALMVAMARQMDANLSASLTRALGDRTRLFEADVRTALTASEVQANSRVFLRRLLAELRRDGLLAPASRADLIGIVNAMQLDQRIQAVSLRDAAGQSISAWSRDPHLDALSLRVNLPREAYVEWHGGDLHLRSHIPIEDEAGLLGTMELEYSLPEASRVIVDLEQVGSSAEVVVCAALSAVEMECLPTPSRPLGFRTGRLFDGQPLPASQALDGSSGVAQGPDYRGGLVNGAHGPVGTLGLGMTVKVDTVEHRAPISSRLIEALPLVLALLAAGVIVLRSQMNPLVRGLARSRERVRAIVEHSGEGIFVINPDDRIESMNPAAAMMFACPAATAPGTPVAELVPSLGPAGAATDALDRARGGATVSLDTQGLRTGGVGFPLALKLRAMPEEVGGLVVAIVRDVTAEREAQRNLEEAKERMAQLLSTTPAVIYASDILPGPVFDCVYISDNVAGQLGYQPGDLLGTEGWVANIHPDDLGRVGEEFLDGYHKGGQAQEYRFRHKATGEYRWLRDEYRIVSHGLGKPPQAFGYWIDITEQKLAEQASRERYDELKELHDEIRRTQEQLLQREKLASIGQLAAGVAHEINNPIGYINSNLATLERYLEDLFQVVAALEALEADPGNAACRAAVAGAKEKADFQFLRDDLFALLRESQEGSGRVRKIVQDLKDFSRAGTQDDWQWVDLHEGLESTLNIVWNELKYKATVRREYGDLPRVECLGSQLNQVFMNLLVNAAHAIHEKGTITLRSGVEGDQVWVEVEDDGAGIAPEHLSRIFDPFFTTKPVGKGTGLGLSLSYGIVRKHGGAIEVASEPGKGTRFRVTLPRQRSAEVKAA